MQVLARSCSCVAIVLIALTGPAMAAVSATNAIATPAIATVRPMDVPRIDLMPRTVVTSQPGVTSRLDVQATHEATKALTTRDVASSKDADAGGDTRLAAGSTGTVTDAVAAAESAPGQSRPMAVSTCR